MQIAIILKAPSLDFVVAENNVIYADAAYKFAKEVGKKNVVAVVGDFDSLGSVPKNENVIGLNVEKNFTDGERAVRYAVEKGYTDLVIYGAFGGKIEHILGNIALLKIAQSLGVNAKIQDGARVVELICGCVALKAKKGGALSLIPYGGNCTFAKSNGLYYPLENLTLTPSDTRGISNVVIEDKVVLEITDGEALVIYEK